MVRLIRSGLAGAGAGLTLIMGLDGTWLWCLVRMLVLGAVVSRLMAFVGGPPRRAVAAVATAAGVVAASAGGAIAYPYLTKSGGSIRTVGGLLTFSGGVLLLAVGAGGLARPIGGWRRLVVIPAGLVLAYGVAYPVVVAVAATNVPRTALGRDTPATLGLGFIDATLRTSDGAPLSGWYVPSANGAAVAMVPGASSTRSGVLRQAAVLARHGYGVLFFDPRGQGRSGGRAMNLGWYGDRDVASALDWLEKRPEVDAGRIGAYGASMGGEEAIGALAADRRLRAVVAEGATNRVAGDLAWLDDVYGLRGRLQQAVNGATSALTDALTAAGRPVTLRAAVSAAAPRPVLLIAAGAVGDEARAAESVRTGAPGSVKVWVVPGAGHVGGLRAQPAEWERRVAGFFDEALAANGRGIHQEVQ